MYFRKTGFITLFITTLISPNTFAQKPVTTIPFTVVNNAIVLRVKINDNPKPLMMLFDTGADGMALSKAAAADIGLKVDKVQNTSVVGGNMKIELSAGNKFQFENGFEYPNQSIALFNDMGKGLDGIVGNNITRYYITRVDLNKCEITLYPPDNYTYEPGGTVVPVTIPQGVFIIPGNVEVTPGKAYAGDFVFDTGASYNLICFRPFVRKNKLLVSGFVPDFTASTVSMGMSSPTFNGNSVSFSFANTQPVKNMPVTLMAGGGQNENWNPGFDGSIGMGIISRYNFTINRPKNEIYLVPNHTYGYPMSFALGGLLFAFNLKSELEVTGFYQLGNNNQAALNTGTKIISINNINSAELVKDAAKIAALKQLPASSPVKIDYLEGNVKQTITLNR
ncbi:retropepsin-like domain-containing protein [Mucilaginibacter mali]|uniref:Retropepsin-like domain-containing protein n=1 Tax=Mucilaginibacter mali TaxID=2740462 RepID=A0A7D4QBM3_9SPHI|nr:retropepsin-like aspartic protease [Mucilaginibacter mali]QKJ32811.1 retropepsin-like domain-containing protein [Mucilaginibacter mali]